MRPQKRRHSSHRPRAARRSRAASSIHHRAKARTPTSPQSSSSRFAETIPHIATPRSQQILFSRRPRLPNRRPDPSTAARDLLIRRAFRALLELIRPIPRKHRMRVRVDKPRHHHAPARVDHFIAAISARSPCATPTRAIRPSRTSIAPSRTIPNVPQFRPDRARRRGPASVTSSEHPATIHWSSMGIRIPCSRATSRALS